MTEPTAHLAAVTFACAAFVFLALAIHVRRDSLALPDPVPSESNRSPRGRIDLLRSVRGGWAAAAPAISAATGAWIGSVLGGPVALVAGCVVGGAVPASVRRRARRRFTEQVDRELLDLVEASALALRAGLSVRQAIEFAADEADEPMRSLTGELLAHQRLGAPSEDALAEFAARLGTREAQLFVLVVTVHSRSGGDLATALGDVATAIRHRLGIRRELQALSAQARLSSAVLVALPAVFFVLLSVTSRAELSAVYRSPAGIAMLATGFAFQGLAYLWIRRLLRVEA